MYIWVWPKHLYPPQYKMVTAADDTMGRTGYGQSLLYQANTLSWLSISDDSIFLVLHKWCNLQSLKTTLMTCVQYPWVQSSVHWLHQMGGKLVTSYLSLTKTVCTTFVSFWLYIIRLFYWIWKTVVSLFYLQVSILILQTFWSDYFH